MQHLDEGTVHAWLDGALPGDEGARIEAHATACAECAAIVAEARGLVAASTRIVSALDATPAGVIPAFGAKRVRWYHRASSRAAIAATLVVAVGLAIRQGGGGQEMMTESVADSAVPLPRRESAAPPPPVASVPQAAASSALAATPTAPAASDAANALEETGPTALAKPQAAAARSLAQGAPPVAASEAARREVMAAPSTATVSAPQVLVGSVGGQARNPAPASAAIPDSARARQPIAMNQAQGDLTLGAGRGGGASQDSMRTARERIPATGISRGVVGGVASDRGLPPSMAAGIGRPGELAALAPGKSLSAGELAGCYELDRSVETLPTRFALVFDSATAALGIHQVWYVDSAGRLREPIRDATWAVTGGQAAVMRNGRGTILLLSRVDSVAQGASVSGTRSGRVSPCK